MPVCRYGLSGTGLPACLGTEMDADGCEAPRGRAWVPVDQPRPETPASFAGLPKRWIVERTFASLVRNCCLARDWERLSATTETWIYLAMSRLMRKRLTLAALLFPASLKASRAPAAS